MTKKRKLFGTLAVLLAFGVAVAWVLSYDTHLGWIHMLGVILSLTVLVVIWFWPGTEQPKGPPP